MHFPDCSPDSRKNNNYTESFRLFSETEIYVEDVITQRNPHFIVIYDVLLNKLGNTSRLKLNYDTVKCIWHTYLMETPITAITDISFCLMKKKIRIEMMQ